MDGLEPRRVYKDKLRTALGTHTGNAMARRLRFARCDADFLTDQRVEQSGFAHIGFSDDGDQTTALVFRRNQRWSCHDTLAFARIEHGVYVVCALRRGVRCVCHEDSLRTWSMAAAAACSPARRDVPMPRSQRANSITSHSTSKVWRCAAPKVPTTR